MCCIAWLRGLVGRWLVRLPCLARLLCLRCLRCLRWAVGERERGREGEILLSLLGRPSWRCDGLFVLQQLSTAPSLFVRTFASWPSQAKRSPTTRPVGRLRRRQRRLLLLLQQSGVGSILRPRRRAGRRRTSLLPRHLRSRKPMNQNQRKVAVGPGKGGFPVHRREVGHRRRRQVHRLGREVQVPAPRVQMPVMILSLPHRPVVVPLPRSPAARIQTRKISR